MKVDWSNKERTPSLLRYGAAVVAVAFAILLRHLLDPILQDRQPFVTLYGAIAFAVWYSGLKPALLATAVGGAAAEFLFIAPRGAIKFESATDVVAVLAYAFTASVIMFFGEAASRSGRKSHDDRIKLDIAQKAAQAGAFEWDARASSANWSDDLRAILGVDPNYPSTRDGWERLLHPEDHARAVQNLEKANSGESEVYDNTYRIITPKGEIKHILSRGKVLFDSQGVPERVVGLKIDVTVHREIEAALLRSEKLAAAGRMAATVAHEINNPLQAVLGHLFLLRQDASVSATAAESVRAVEDDIRRVAALAQRSLSFFRASNLTQPVRLPEVITDVVDVYRRQAEIKGVELKFAIEGTCVTSGNPDELKQVLSNLILNALDAMPRGGKLTVGSRIEGDSIQLFVQDTGSGIPKEHLPRIFDAFFTTRQGVGTGLGLWFSKSIIESMGGSIRVQTNTSTEPRGTKMIVQLPIHDERANPAHPSGVHRPLQT